MDRRAIVISLALIAAFLFTRLYKLPSSLLFFNDMGRDFLELYEWKDTGIPPLLGPQTSAFSFNHSAFYYYLLYPAYLVSGQSPFASVYAVIFWYIGWFLFSLYSFKNKSTERFSLFIAALLIILQPEIWRQTRFVWNPSFTPPLLLAMLYAFHSFRHRVTPQNSWLFAGAAALAIGLSPASLPLVSILILLAIIKYKWSGLKLLAQTLINGLVVFSPAFIFELRHRFALTYLLLHGQRLPQAATSLAEKSLKLNQLVLSMPPTLTLILLTIILYITFKSSNHSIRQSMSHSSPPIILLLLIITTFILPINIESHYIFPLTVTLIYTLANLPKKIALLFSLIFVLNWSRSPTIQQQFQPARRTVAQLQSCYQQFCASHPGPIYVSMQSGILPYHNAPEHRYFMKTAGCQVKDIEKTQTESQYMAVVVDDSTYQHGQTAYNELTLFGPSQETEVIFCQENLQIHVLQKI